jgi:thiamine transport system ATP-binding protein
VAEFRGAHGRSDGQADGSTARLCVATPPLRLAVRRSAFRVDPEGGLRGTVVEARTTPEQVRLVVEVEGIGELDAVSPLDQHPGVGEPVRLFVDATRTAVVGGADPCAAPSGPP